MRTGLSLLFCLLLFATHSTHAGEPAVKANPERPNILWITSEDNGPQLGIYGDDYSVTPNIDRLGKLGMRYRTCWSNAPVCAPARTTIISGMYPTALGGQHMRSEVRLPEGFQMYPQYLREAGYYCTNHTKEDYNLKKPGRVWDKPSHWKNRAPGQPFFSIFNITTSHESRLRTRPHKQEHDPAGVRVPDYHPDTPEVRQDWAQYYDKLTQMDREVGQRLKELEDAGLMDDTIIFYYGDHGSGMPRSKRWPFNSGLHVPLIVHIPEKWKHLAADDYQPGGVSDRLVAFVDLAPTVLSLIGIKPPAHMHGKAFLGEFQAKPKDYLFGFRGRMDERYDMVRSVTDGRFVYLRQFMPHRIYGQHVNYMFITPTTRIWREMYDRGELTPQQAAFWEVKPSEELYDLRSDPDEVNNLADDPAHAETVARFRSALKNHQLGIRDLGFLPEPMMWERTADRTPYELGQDRDAYPLEEIREVADYATSRSKPDVTPLTDALTADDAAIRYWAALGLLVRGEDAVRGQTDKLLERLGDSSPTVSIVAAECLLTYGQDDVRKRAIDHLIEHSDPNAHGTLVALFALNALDMQSDLSDDVKERIEQLPGKAKKPQVPGRYHGYPARVRQHLLGDFPPNR